MKQSLVDGFLAYYDAARAAARGFSVVQSKDIALRLLELEHEWAFSYMPPEPPSTGPAAPTRWFEVTDFGLMSEEMLRAKVHLDHMTHNHRDMPLDDLMVDVAVSFGKVVTPLDPAVPPFYLINGDRESIYQLRLRIKALFDDNGNVMSRDEVVARLRANNDTVQEL